MKNLLFFASLFLQFYVPGVVAIKITVMPRIVLRLFVLTSFAVLELK